jgi:hypothetical protein
VDFRVLGDTEVCCGENYRRMGNELQFQMNAQMNMELFGSVKFKRLVVTNPHCHQVFGKDYKDFVPEDWDGIPFEVVSVEQLVADLVAKKGLPGRKDLGKVAYHDSCMYGRYNGIPGEGRWRAAGGAGPEPRERVLLRRRRWQLLAGGARAPGVVESRRGGHGVRRPHPGGVVPLLHGHAGGRPQGPGRLRGTSGEGEARGGDRG